MQKEKETCAGPPVYVDGYDPKTNNFRLHRDHLEHKSAALAKELHVSQNLARRLAEVVARHEAAASGQEAQEDVAGVLRRLAKELETRSPGKGSPEEMAAMLLASHAGDSFGTDADGACKHDTLLGVFSDSLYNLDRPAKGHRYCKSTKYLFAAIAIRYGPAAAEFVALNVGGPMRTTTKNDIPKYKYCVGIEGVEQLVKDMVPMYKALMKKLIKEEGITAGSVHVKLAEDETATLRELHWNEANDTLEGSCGLKMEHIGQRHRCRDDCVIPIHAGGVAGYKAIVDAFGAYQIGDYGRIIMYNPCHKKLPPMVIFVAPTCNRFDKEYVDRQWRCISRICNIHLGHVVGTVCGNDSDGDSRRRSLQQEKALSKVGCRYKPPNCAGYDYTGRLTTVGEEFGDVVGGEGVDYKGGEDGREDEDYKPGEAAECPFGHTLQELRTDEATDEAKDEAGYECDGVCQAHFTCGTALHSCRVCNYDVCASCLPNILGTYETAEEKADGSYEEPPAEDKADEEKLMGAGDSHMVDVSESDAQAKHKATKEATEARMVRARRRCRVDEEAMEEEEAEEEAEEAEEVAPTSMFAFAGGRFEVTTDEREHLQDSLTTWEACQCEGDHERNSECKACRCKEEHLKAGRAGLHPRCPTCEAHVVSRNINGVNVILEVKNMLCFAKDGWLDDDCLHQFETQELTYLLVCCSADKGRRALLSTGTPSHTQA
jgi:hypothetical protein